VLGRRAAANSDIDVIVSILPADVAHRRPWLNGTALPTAARGKLLGVEVNRQCTPRLLAQSRNYPSGWALALDGTSRRLFG
jgi:hypothetical protein